MYRIGIVSAVDADTARARVKFPARGDVESYWLEVLQGNTFSNRDNRLPDVGETVAVLLDETEESGCILGAVYDSNNKPPTPSANARRVTFADGTVIEYDRAAHKLKVTTTGDVDVSAAHVNITAALKVTGNSETTGTSQLTGNVTVGGGAEQVALATKTANALTSLKNAISAGVTVPQDGGASLKTTILAGLAAWPPSLAASKLSSD